MTARHAATALALACATALTACTPTPPAPVPSTASPAAHDVHEPLLDAGAVNTTTQALTVTGVQDAADVVGHLPAELRERVSVSPADLIVGSRRPSPARTDPEGWTVTVAAGTPKGLVDQAAAALEHAYGPARVRIRTVTWGAVTFRAPLTAGAAYVKAIGANPAAPASATTTAQLDELAQGGWGMSVDRDRGELVLMVAVQRTLTEADLARLRKLFAVESGAPAPSVRLVPGVPEAE